jgi:hypothetical protein
MIERVIAELVSARDRHRQDALRRSVSEGADPAFIYGVAVGTEAGLSTALQLIDKVLSDLNKKDEL